MHTPKFQNKFIGLRALVNSTFVATVNLLPAGLHTNFWLLLNGSTKIQRYFNFCYLFRKNLNKSILVPFKCTQFGLVLIYINKNPGFQLETGIQ